MVTLREERRASLCSSRSRNAAAVSASARVTLVAAERGDLVAARMRDDQAGEHLGRERPVHADEVDDRPPRCLGQIVSRHEAPEEHDLPDELRRASSEARRNDGRARAREHGRRLVAARVDHASGASAYRGRWTQGRAAHDPRDPSRAGRSARRGGSARAPRRSCARRGSSHSSSRCETHFAPKTSGGPSPTAAYAMRLPSSSQKRMSCSITRECHGPNGPCQQDGPSSGSLGPCVAFTRRYMQSRYVRRAHRQIAAGRRHRDRVGAVRAPRRALARAPLLRREAAPLGARAREPRTRRPRPPRPRRLRRRRRRARRDRAPRPRRLDCGDRIRRRRRATRAVVSGPSSRASSQPTRALRASRSSWPRCAATTRASSRSCKRLGSLRTSSWRGGERELVVGL